MTDNDKNRLLSPREAQELIGQNVSLSPVVELPLPEAANCVAADDIVAREAYPWFSFSAMDGYAVRAAELESAAEDSPVRLPVNGEIRAGDTARHELQPGSSMRIMTGAPLPAGADAVVMREVVTEEEGGAVFSAPVKPWTAVNRAGEEIEPGRLLVAAGTRLRAPSLGLLAAMGFSAAVVRARPGVAVITTGDELLAPGQVRSHGQIYDSIAPMLSAALGVWGAGEVTLRRCRDNVDTLHTEIETVLDCLDVVLVVGGVSVGDYDFTLPALERAGVKKIFHGVAQKPGKPLYFGKTTDGRLAFGLPGNPASALVCGAVYVRRAMELMAGVANPQPRIIWAVAGEELTNRTGRTQFVRVETTVRGDGVLECRSAGGQGSYMLSSFAVSDCLAELPPGPVTVSHGEPVALYPLGWD